MDLVNKNITTGPEASYLMHHIRKTGLINLVYFKTLMSDVGNKIANILGGDKGDPKVLETVMNKYKELGNTLVDSPMLFESLFF